MNFCSLTMFVYVIQRRNMKKSHSHAKHVWFDSLDSQSDMTSILDLSSRNSTLVIKNGVGEKAWLPESPDFYGFYNYKTEVTKFGSLKWTKTIVDHDAEQDKSYPISVELKINTLVLPNF